MTTTMLQPGTGPKDALRARVHRWTRAEYHKMAEMGFFAGKRVELIGGEIIEMSAMGRPHVIAVRFTAQTLEKAFGRGWFVQTQAPLALGENAEPEPDVAVIAGNFLDYQTTHPTSAALIVEVADATISEDRKWKGSFYASVGISDYWVLNLKKRQLEVYRRPIPDQGAPFDFVYAERMVFNEKDKTSLLAKPKAVVRIADLLS
ncbi:MAG TPA: Uma2 family endonuclease [Blastocatellia bacterium]|nr:Uma2 family endonuclease [Blastocatellia bacterium]